MSKCTCTYVFMYVEFIFIFIFIFWTHLPMIIRFIIIIIRIIIFLEGYLETLYQNTNKYTNGTWPIHLIQYINIAIVSRLAESISTTDGQPCQICLQYLTDSQSKLISQLTVMFACVCAWMGYVSVRMCVSSWSSVCLCVFVGVCVSLWMCIPANVSFPVCVSCLNTVVSVCGSVCVSLWMFIPANVSFPVCCVV